MARKVGGRSYGQQRAGKAGAERTKRRVPAQANEIAKQRAMGARGKEMRKKK